MRLPLIPPVKPMLAKSVPEIPKGDFSYEPKWDGFRSIVFRDGDEVEIGSRNERPMTRYFPELVEAVKANLPERSVVDGEIVVPDPSGKRLEAHRHGHAEPAQQDHLVADLPERHDPQLEHGNQTARVDGIAALRRLGELGRTS